MIVDFMKVKGKVSQIIKYKDKSDVNEIHTNQESYHIFQIYERYFFVNKEETLSFIIHIKAWISEILRPYNLRRNQYNT